MLMEYDEVKAIDKVHESDTVEREEVLQCPESKIMPK
jgi:hypothetical protein